MTNRDLRQAGNATNASSDVLEAKNLHRGARDEQTYLRQAGWHTRDCPGPWRWAMRRLPGAWYTLRDAVALQRAMDKRIKGQS